MKDKKRMNEDEDFDSILNAMDSYKPSPAKSSITPSKKETKEALNKSKPEKKSKITEASLEEMIKKAKEDAKKELKNEELVDNLKKISGVEVISSFDPSKKYTFNTSAPNKNYIAKCNGMKFFAQGICILTYSGEIGYYNSKNGYYKPKVGSREKISDLIKNNGIPLKYRRLTKMLVEAATSTSGQDITQKTIKAFESLTSYSTVTIKAILKAAKWLSENKNIDIFNLVRQASKKNETIKKFYDKNKEAFKELA